MNQYWAAGIFAFYLLSCAGSSYVGYKYEAEKCLAKDEAHDLAQSQNTVAAEKNVVGVVQKQGTISQEASNEYAKSTAIVHSAYRDGVQQPSAGPVNSVPAICRTAGGAKASRVSRVYHLTHEQCDQEEAKFNALWNWSTRQAAAR